MVAGMGEPLVLGMSFRRFDAALGTNADVWRQVKSRLFSNGGHLTIVLTDRTLYDVTAVVFNREQVSAYASLYRLSLGPAEDEWDLFWKVVDAILANSEYDGYLYVPPEIEPSDFGVVIFYRTVA